MEKARAIQQIHSTSRKASYQQPKWNEHITGTGDIVILDQG